MSLNRDQGRREKPDPKHGWLVPVLVIAALAVFVFVGIVVALSGQSFF